MKNRDLVAQIQEIRARNKVIYPVTIPRRMLALASAFRSAPGLDEEFLRYVPIGIVACFEGFFRAAVRECVDFGEPFVNRVRELKLAKDLRFELELLFAVHGRRVTIGEVIAHLVPTNAIEQITDTMTTLTGSSFVDRLRTTRSSWDMDVEGRAPLIIENLDDVLASMREAFRLRHIHVHELAEAERPNRTELTRLLESAVTFLEASAEAIGQLLHPNAPRTQAAANALSAGHVARLDTEVAAALGKLEVRLNPERRTLLQESQRAWEHFRLKQAQFVASEYDGGSMHPQVLAQSQLDATQARLSEIEHLISELDDGRYSASGN